MKERDIKENIDSPWRKKLFEVIFEADTPAGKCFDLLLILSIVLSVTVMLSSVKDISDSYGSWLRGAELFFTGLFTIEYILRLICVGRPLKYAFSFFGIVDFLAVAPTYFTLLIPSGRYMAVIRTLRVLRIFRILKLSQCVQQADVLLDALAASKRKILVFMVTVLTLVVILGSLMYLIEGEDNGFTSIPRSVYWAIVTLTTVGYGDISPKTAPGQCLASLVIILGYAIIAVPTGIVSVEFSKAFDKKVSSQVCPECTIQGHEPDAVYYKICGAKL